MICSTCGGIVIWKGPFSALTHTECQQCGAINNQVVAEPNCEYCDGTGDVHRADGEYLGKCDCGA